MVIAVALLAAGAAAKADTLKSEESTSAPPVSDSSGEEAFQDYATGSWWGERSRLAQSGVSVNAALVLEGFRDFQGGLKRGSVGASTFDLNLSLDTERAFNWQGGTFYVDLEDHAGRNPSATLVGDLQVFDKLNYSPYLQVFELWYQQQLFDGKLRLKLGKVDANTEYSVINNGLPFLNASTQVTPTIIVFPTTPDPMPGVNLFFTPTKFWYASFGAFAANQSDNFGNFIGHPEAAQLTESGTFLIGETGFTWEHAPLLGTDGNLKVGAWGHTGSFPRLDGGQQQGASGYYAVFDQTLWKPTDAMGNDRGLRTFLEGGNTQARVSTIDWNLAGGFSWTGPLDARPDDVLGVSVEYAHVSYLAGLAYPYELAMEWLYRVQLTQWASIMPDMQYMIHPGAEYANAVVGTLNLSVQF